MHCDRKMSKSKINVIKIPRENGVVDSSKDAEFPRMPRMYLELIENKDKIKPGMVNKEYDPDEVATVMSEKSVRPRPDTSSWNPDEQIEEEEGEAEEEYEDEDDIEKEEEKEEDDAEKEEEDEKEEEADIEKEEEESLIEEEEEEELPHLPSFDRMNEDIEENFDDDFDDDFIKRNSASPSRPLRPPEDDRVSMSSSTKMSAPPLTREENLQKNKMRERLKEILHDPPKLSDLEKRGEVKTKRVIPNLPRQTMEEEDELKRELLYKFDLLKRGYKNVDIPEFNMHSDYKNMNKTYENTLRRVSLDSSVENYRNYLIAGFMVMEYVLGYWLRFDMAGFTQQQILNMNQYERMLIELGEKSYVPDDKKWPVELRLLGMIVLNAVIFIIAKMIITKTGTNLFGLMNAQQSEFQKNTHKVKRKMRGPNIDLSNIPDLDDVSTTSA